MKRLFRSLLVLWLCWCGGAISGCSSETPKAGLGDKCEDTPQCDTLAGLTCRCVRRKSADEEGPELVIAPGTCQPSTFVCPTVDAGPGFDAGDSGPRPETGSDAGSDVLDGATDATDGASDAPADAADGATSDGATSDADADGG